MGAVQHPVDFVPLGRQALCPEGVTLLDAARRAGLRVTAVCDGQGTCGKCRVQAGGCLGAPTPVEEALLGPDELQDGYRLACQARLRGPAVVRLAAFADIAYKAGLPGPDAAVPLAPNVQKSFLCLDPPSLGDTRADLERLSAALPNPLGPVDLAALRDLPAVLRTSDWAVTTVHVGGQLVKVEAGDTREQSYGLAFDLGTTSVAAYLLDLNGGKLLGAAVATNQQVIYGDDVISRIARAHAGGLAALRQAAVETLNALVEEVCRRGGVSPERVYEATVVGNTCMLQLLLGIDPYPLGVAPYVPAVVDGLDLSAEEVGLDLSPGARLHLLPSVAGYVGADAVANVLTASQRGAVGARLIVDLGTNAEMVLCCGERAWACATAAGPAFEGARISCGMRAAPGAIDRVEVVAGQVRVHALEERPPLGLAGSGLISAAAALRRQGLLTARGRFVPAAAPAGLFSTSSGEVLALLVPASASGTGKAITLSQRDIAELLLAKAAVAAGLRVLLDTAGLAPESLDEVLIAGSFGNSMDRDAALDIGLLPPLPPERLLGMGNAAGRGAILALLSREMRRRADQIARGIAYIELSAHPAFGQEFLRQLSFPDMEAR